MSPPRLPRPVKIFFAAIIAVALSLFVGYRILSRDEPPPDVSDLQLVYRDDIPDNQNAYALLTALVQSIPAELLNRDDEHADSINRIISGEDWDADLANQILSGSSTLWPRLQTAVAAPHSQAPLVEDIESDSNITPLYQLHRLALVRSRQLVHTGQPEQTLDLLLALNRMGYHLCDSQGQIVTLLTGISIQDTAIENIRSLADSPEGWALDLHTILAELERHRHRPEHWSAAMRQEQRFFQLAVDAVLTSPDHQAFLRLNGLSAWWERRRLKLLFKPNQTIRLHADYTRRFISLAHTDQRTLGASNLDQDFAAKNNPKNWFNPVNLVGRLILSMTTGRMQPMLADTFDHQSRLSATQAFLAVRAYQQNHDGALPPTLDALVPDYLPAVPLDYYDRAPIRYSREFRAIWSLGRDGDHTVTSADQPAENGEVYLRLP